MKRETRLNLIFLVAFVLISLPGAVILFKKKLEPGSRPIFMTDEVERRLPYMVPGATPPGYKRVGAPLTESWLASLVAERAPGTKLLLSADARGTPLPVLSEDHQLQAVAARRTSDRTLYDFALWDPPASVVTSDFAAAVKIEDKTIPATVQHVESIQLPQLVKRELMNLGMIKPPIALAWIVVDAGSIGAQSAGTAVEVHISYPDHATRETITIPLISDAVVR